MTTCQTVETGTTPVIVSSTPLSSSLSFPLSPPHYPPKSQPIFFFSLPFPSLVSFLSFPSITPSLYSLPFLSLFLPLPPSCSPPPFSFPLLSPPLLFNPFLFPQPFFLFCFFPPLLFLSILLPSFTLSIHFSTHPFISLPLFCFLPALLSLFHLLPLLINQSINQSIGLFRNGSQVAKQLKHRIIIQ